MGRWLLVTQVQQFGLGALKGLVRGVEISELLLRVRSNEGLHALLLCSGGAMVFALTNLVGGSGFLAIYLTGLVAGNRRGGTGDNVLKSMDSMAWLAQSGMFLILGLLVTPSRLTEHLAWRWPWRPSSCWRGRWPSGSACCRSALPGARKCSLPGPAARRRAHRAGSVPVVAEVEQTYLLFDITLWY